MSRKIQGFTLVEMIAVLMVLGIIAVIAIPKYIDLREKSAQRVAEGGIAAGMTALSLKYSKDLLANNMQPWKDDKCGHIDKDDIQLSENMEIDFVPGNGDRECIVKVIIKEEIVEESWTPPGE